MIMNSTEKNEIRKTMQSIIKYAQLYMQVDFHEKDLYRELIQSEHEKIMLYIKFGWI